MNTNPSLLVGVFGIGAMQIASYYEQVAPSLQEVRDARHADVRVRQQLLDANLQVTALAIIFGGLGWYATKDITPLVISLAIVGLVAVWRSMVLSDDPNY